MSRFYPGPAQWLSGRASALWPGGCGFDPQPGHTKDFKNGTSCFRLALSIKKVELGIGTGQLSVSITWLGGISCQSVWGMIFQCGSTLKVSIALPVTSSPNQIPHRNPMDERACGGNQCPYSTETTAYNEKNTTAYNNCITEYNKNIMLRPQHIMEKAKQITLRPQHIIKILQRIIHRIKWSFYFI